jgi:hypothetical protein
MKNSSKEVFGTDYFLVIVDQPLMAPTTQFKQVEEYASNFSFLHDVKRLKEMNDDDLKTHCMDLHIVLSDEDSHDMNSVDLFSELGCCRKSYLKVIILYLKPFSIQNR